MSLLCPICDDGSIPVVYTENCQVVQRPFGANRFGLIKCGYEFTDITDPAEWEAAITALDVIMSPIGNFALQEIASEIAFTDGCGTEYRDIATAPFIFETNRTAEDYSDEAWYTALDQFGSTYNLFWVNCDACRIYLPKDQIDLIGVDPNITSPGFRYSLTSIPQFVAGPQGAGRAGLWRVNGNFRTKTVLNSIELPGVCEILNGGTVI
jgi:hypothetical protein